MLSTIVWQLASGQPEHVKNEGGVVIAFAAKWDHSLSWHTASCPASSAQGQYENIVRYACFVLPTVVCAFCACSLALVIIPSACVAP